MQQGIAQGVEQGKLYTLFALVDEGLITVNKAAEMAGISAEDFKLKKENWK